MARAKRKKFADDVQSSTGGEVSRILPSCIRVDHTLNASRWAPYDTPAELREHIGDKCCFTLEQIEQRLKSLLSEGQIEDVTVSMSNTGHPDLVLGYLRHAAFLLAEVRGTLGDIPGAKGTKVSGIRAKVISAPKTQADHADLARRNLAENRERKEMSPVDLAFYIQRRLSAFDDKGELPSREQVAAELDMSKRSLDRYVQMLSARPDQLLKVHSGEMRMSALIAEMHKKGQGKAGRSNPGIQRKAMRRRDAANRPSCKLTPEQIDALIDLVNGDKTIEDIGSDTDLAVWRKYLDAPKPPKADAKPRKKAPPKAGQRGEAA